MSSAFRALLQQVGSGAHTSQSLTREAAARAMVMMLQQEATPAQIGAFMIAHRIKRPTPAELAGMLDAYEQLGPQLASVSDQPLWVFGHPYDGRSRTAPVAPILSLLLAAAEIPSLHHGGRRMPTKFGIPLVDLWQLLGVDWTRLSLAQLQTVLAKTGMGLVYLPEHFPLAEGLTIYREELGKRPPIASMELVWNPYAGPAMLVAGFVHPPTEERLLATLALRGHSDVIFVKGLEGSCDLARDRSAILSRHQTDQPPKRLILHARDYDLGGPEIPFLTDLDWQHWAKDTLTGESNPEVNPLWPAVLWNGGFYLWQAGVAPSLATGIEQTRSLLQSGAVGDRLNHLQQTLTHI